MDATSAGALRDLVVAQGLVSASAADEVLAQCQGDGADYGERLVAAGLLTHARLADVAPAASGGATMLDATDASPPQGAGVGGATVVDPNDGPPATAPPAAAGDRHLGRTYSGCVVERKLGQGGMGSVYVARREADARKVVIKVLAEEQAMNQAWRARFLREARMLQSISHPNIVEIHSVEGEGSVPYIVMELVDGEGLDDRLKRGRLEPREAARICRDIALALAHAHKSGIIHRDIKPANVLLTKDGRVKVLDFGLAKSIQTDESLSVAGQALGTPHYMAPEQWGDHAVDARADVYALGATLYTLVTRRLPFDGPTTQQIQQLVLAGKFTPPRQVLPELPEDLELVVLRAMAHDRRYRYATAGECGDDLTRFLEGQPVEVPRLVEKVGARRHPLLPAVAFTIGRDATCEISVNDRSVSRQHARVTREPTGFVIADLGSSYGTNVGGMRLKKEVLLKDGDEIVCGKLALVFHDGGLTRSQASRRQTARLTTDALRVRQLPVPFVNVLGELADRRVVVALLEEFAPDAHAAQIQATQEMLVPILGGDTAEAVRGKMESRLRRARARAPHYLFAITRENLGDDVEAWLAWWDQARENYPPQIASQDVARSRPFLTVTKGEPVERKILLDDSPITPIGRDETCRVMLNSTSVSRVHASILHLNRRDLIRDEGSRFGTLLNGQKVRIGFLSAGDRLVLGLVELVYDLAPPDLGATDMSEEAFAIDPEAFFVLVEMKHPSTVAGLVRFLDLDATDWIGAESSRVFDDPKRAQELAAQVRAVYAKEAARAKKLVPELLGIPSLEDSHERLSLKKPDLPPQLVPAGWFPRAAAAGRP